jgi:hypothetical protein
MVVAPDLGWWRSAILGEEGEGLPDLGWWRQRHRVLGRKATTSGAERERERERNEEIRVSPFIYNHLYPVEMSLSWARSYQLMIYQDRYFIIRE